MQGFDCPASGELFPVKISSPTCEDLGIPKDCDDMCVSVLPSRVIQNPSLHIDGIRYEAAVKGTIPNNDPFSPLCMIPLPSPFTLEHLEPTYVRKRNERERERVRCVNDGYSRLKEHLPLENKNKRISKVETLRRAIEYIRYLQSLLAEDDANMTSALSDDAPTFDFSDCGDISEEELNRSENQNTKPIEITEEKCHTEEAAVKYEHTEDDLATCCLKRKMDENENNVGFLKRKCVQNA